MNTQTACFAGDFGGYFGLFLGGSAISLFEVLDLVIYNAFVKLTTRTAQQGPEVVNVDVLEGQPTVLSQQF